MTEETRIGTFEVYNRDEHSPTLENFLCTRCKDEKNLQCSEKIFHFRNHDFPNEIEICKSCYDALQKEAEIAEEKYVDPLEIIKKLPGYTEVEENKTSSEEDDYAPNYDIDIISVFHGEQELHAEYSKAAMKHVEELIRRTQFHVVAFVNANGLECGHQGYREYDNSKIEKTLQSETKRRKQEKFPMESTYFYWSDCCEYSVSGECSYELEQDDIIFDLFFAFKLRHIDLMEMDDFLDFHAEEYEGDFKRFLSLLTRKFKTIISDEIKETISEWKVKVKDKKGSSTSNNEQDSEDVDFHFPEPPEGYRKIKGTLTDEQVIIFFSFLYKEENKPGQTFMIKSEVDDLLKFGLVISENPPSKYFSLRHLKAKGIIYYCFQQFFHHHSEVVSVNKKDIALFLKNNFTNFKDVKIETIESSLRSDKKPPKMNFDLNNYL